MLDGWRYGCKTGAEPNLQRYSRDEHESAIELHKCAGRRMYRSEFGKLGITMGSI